MEPPEAWKWGFDCWQNTPTGPRYNPCCRDVTNESWNFLYCRAGQRFAGLSPDGLSPETVEYADQLWFIGVQYHPELKSRPFEPHPLFANFIAAAMGQSRLV